MPRTAHVPEYRLRVDDQLDMLYRITRDEIRGQYRLNVGDEVRIESFTDPELNRSLMVQPDGMITLRLLGQVHAAGRTVTQLRDALEELYKKYYKVPSITVTPSKVNTQLDDLRSVVDRRYGAGGQGANVRVAPDGTISLTAIGYVRAQGLTLDELRQEINERYREKIEGMEIIPVLDARAPRYRLRAGRGPHAGPLRDGRADDRPAGHGHGGQLERGREHLANRGLPPRRRLAADGHDGQPARGPARQAALPQGRNLALRQRRDHRAQGPHPGGRRLHQSGLHPRSVRRLPLASEHDLRQAGDDLTLAPTLDASGKIAYLKRFRTFRNPTNRNDRDGIAAPHEVCLAIKGSPLPKMRREAQ